MRGDDDDVRDLFADANPDGGPGLRISPEDIAEHAHRVHRRRRQLATAGGTVAVLAVAILLGTVVRPHARPVSPAGPGTSTQVPVTHTGQKPQAPLPAATTTAGAPAPPTATTTIHYLPTTTVTTSHVVSTP
jgi:hypothetical protein